MRMPTSDAARATGIGCFYDDPVHEADGVLAAHPVLVEGRDVDQRGRVLPRRVRKHAAAVGLGDGLGEGLGEGLGVGEGVGVGDGSGLGEGEGVVPDTRTSTVAVAEDVPAPAKPLMTIFMTDAVLRNSPLLAVPSAA